MHAFVSLSLPPDAAPVDPVAFRDFCRDHGLLGRGGEGYGSGQTRVDFGPPRAAVFRARPGIVQRIGEDRPVREITFSTVAGGRDLGRMALLASLARETFGGSLSCSPDMEPTLAIVAGHP